MVFLELREDYLPQYNAKDSVDGVKHSMIDRLSQDHHNQGIGMPLTLSDTQNSTVLHPVYHPDEGTRRDIGLDMVATRPTVDPVSHMITSLINTRIRVQK